MRRLRSWSWIVLVTMLFGTLAPAAAQAFARPNTDAWMPVCTTAGAQPSAADTASDAQRSSGEQPSRASVECVFCLAGAHAAALPVPPRIAQPAAVAIASAPRRAGVPAPAVALLLRAQPRAPPTAS